VKQEKPGTGRAKNTAGGAKYRAPALEKGLDILQLLSSERTPLTVTAICERLGRSQGEIFRMVQVLQARGFIGQDPGTDGYHLTDLLFSMAMRQPMTQSLVEVAIPTMRTLASEIGQSCHLAVHARGDIVIVARMESLEQIGFTVRVGYRREITKTASGLTLFAFQPEDIRARWLSLVEPKPSPAEVKKFMAAAVVVRSEGFAREASSVVSGITDISAPIMRGDRAIAALTVPYIKTTHAQGSISTVIAKVKSSADSIGSRLTEGDSRA
jgi:DNA-binding IclR family transcriptional regulator